MEREGQVELTVIKEICPWIKADDFDSRPGL